jgi:hypothetical protein
MGRRLSIHAKALAGAAAIKATRQKSIAEPVSPKGESSGHPIKDDCGVQETMDICRDGTHNKRRNVRPQAYPATRRALSAVI